MRFEGETLQAHSQFQQVVLPPASIESTQTPNGSGHGEHQARSPPPPASPPAVRRQRVELQAASQQKAAGWCPTRPPSPAPCCPWPCEHPGTRCMARGMQDVPFCLLASADGVAPQVKYGAFHVGEDLRDQAGEHGWRTTPLMGSTPGALHVALHCCEESRIAHGRVVMRAAL